MDKNLLNLIIKNKATTWLKENPLHLNNQEKQRFLLGLKNFINNNTSTIDDEVFDFLVQCELINSESREDYFMKYLLNKYKNLNNKNILDVGAGRICSLSKAIASKGANVTAMDTNIRLTNETLGKDKIMPIKKLFKCDEYAKNGNGTNIVDYNLIVGLEPCDATEHIIRQSLKYEKPFDILLCAAPHKALNGKTFRNYMEWYEHLAGISREVSIIKKENNYIATNNENLEM